MLRRASTLQTPCVGDLLPASGARGGDTKDSRRNQNARGSDGGRSDSADSSLHGAGTDSRAGISPGFLRVPAETVGTACGSKGSSAVLGERLGSAGINRPEEGT